MKSLKEREGEEIIAILPFLHAAQLQRVKLHKVEEAGIWIESQPITNAILTGLRQPVGTKTPVWFVPWHQVTLIMDSLDQVALSEKAFGL